MTVSLEGWNIVGDAEAEWVPWGDRGDARAKILGSADGYVVALVEAQAGYVGTPHEHTSTEFFYLVEGSIRNQGRELTTGDGFAAAAGSTHGDFEANTPSRYVSIFRV